MAKVIKVQPVMDTFGKPMQVPELSPSGDLILVDNPDNVKGMDGKILKQPKMKEGNTADLVMVMIRLFPRNRLSMASILTALKVRERLEKVSDGCFTLEDTEYSWVITSLKDDAIGVQLFGFDVVNVIKAIEEV